MKTTRRTLSIGLATALALAACGGGAGTPTAAPGATTAGGTRTTAPGAVTGAPGAQVTQGPAEGPVGDVCALLTADDIEAATGLELETPGAKGPGFGSLRDSCGWELAAADGPAPTVTLGVQETGGRRFYDMYVAAFDAQTPDKAIPGVGDAAADVGGGSIVVLSGERILQLQYLTYQETDIEISTELAKKVVHNLGG